MFTKILIANRGEIACRIIATCRRLGIRTVAVYSEADASARHVRLADEAHCVGPAASRESYLRGDAILAVAHETGAQAIHPGYGFLSENEGFAQACAEAGLVFIGPPVDAIRAMGSKSAAKSLMERARVPLVPGYHGDEQEPAHLHAQADRIGYPVLIKATAGGGGKGMRVVERSQDFLSSLASCQREARSSFGDERVLIEKYLQRPRHIEIQVFGDTQGQVISLHERDCSAQRRHQKVVEEAPAPGMTPQRRAAMSQAACEAARAVGYVGAGTVEFIVDASGDFYFMEMNTRLQVEHPVTEMITGLDLVEWQLRVASGEPLPLAQDQVPLRGHSIEVRLYAEEPEKGFLPSIGSLKHLAVPATSPHVRIDSGVETGDVVSPYYDPMLAKLIVWDETRERACERMLKALGEVQIVGLGHNVRFLARLVAHPEFRAGTVDTGLIERASATLLGAEPQLAPNALQAATVWVLQQQSRRLQSIRRDSLDPHSPWQLADAWRLNAPMQRLMRFQCGEQTHEVRVDQDRAGLRIDGARVEKVHAEGPVIGFLLGSQEIKASVLLHREMLHVFVGGHHVQVLPVDPLAHAGEEQDAHGGLTAPMPGKVIALLAKPGDVVDKGTPLVVMEAMKMEHSLVAPARGSVLAYRYAVGEQVEEGRELVEFKPLPAA